MGVESAAGSIVHVPGAGRLSAKYVVLVSGTWKARALSVCSLPVAGASIRRPPGPTRLTCGGPPWPYTPMNPDGRPWANVTVRTPPACAAAATAR
jgi:hypothetical protein